MAAGIPEYVLRHVPGQVRHYYPSLIAGAFAERVRFRGYCIFIALWALLVYNPLSLGVGPRWLPLRRAKGAIDFAGGTVVHISSGITGLVCLYLGKRKGYPTASMHPNNS